MVHKVQLKRDFPGRNGGMLALTVAVAGGLAACSADISRFNFDDNRTTTSALPSTTPPEPVYGTRSGLGRTSQPSKPFDTVERGSLAPPPNPPRYDAPSRYDTSNTTYQGPRGQNQQAQVAPVTPEAPEVAYNAPRKTQVLNAAPNSGFESAPARGQPIFVRRGDTLYGLSRRHGTSVSALMRANNLSSSALRPGQKLYLPSGARPATVAAAPPVSEPAVVEPADAPAHWNETYTIARGDSLYRLSRRYNVKIADLKRYNGISNPRALKPGMVLKVPGPGGADGTLSAPSTTSRVAARKVRTRPIAGSPTLLNGADAGKAPAQETKVAAVKPTTTTDAARRSGQSMTVRPSTTRNSIAGTSKLRWPARGRIISGFGKRNDGTHNDGINVAVPLGTNIHAAESGMVAYAGNELKGYGNLVLIRHDNGWVTAYAHADKLLVKRGDRIRRGDVIAKAGKTGDVAQPQLHFEVRQGQKPVNPIPFMDRL